jgi:glycine cleavage system aminomethyltransferase T
VRITYLGELGYELYVPTEHALHVYDRLVEAGEPMGLRSRGCGRWRACAWRRATATTATTSTTPTRLEAGLGFAVDLKKPHGFIGKDAVLAKKAEGPLKRRLVQVLVKDPAPMLYHAEVIRRDGRDVGYVRAGSYGHTLGGAVGLAMIGADVPVDAAYLASGDWHIEIAGKRYPMVASLRPLYDPNMLRVKA